METTRRGSKLSISIHTPHTGSDDGYRKMYAVLIEFQSTLPIQGVTNSLHDF